MLMPHQTERSQQFVGILLPRGFGTGLLINCTGLLSVLRNSVYKISCETPLCPILLTESNGRTNRPLERWARAANWWPTTSKWCSVTLSSFQKTTWKRHHKIIMFTRGSIPGVGWLRKNLVFVISRHFRKLLISCFAKFRQNFCYFAEHTVYDFLQIYTEFFIFGTPCLSNLQYCTLYSTVD